MRSLFRLRRRLDSLGLRQIRRVVVFVIGCTVVLLGVAMLVLPGPAVIVIPAGLAFLGLEFRWARRWLRKAKTMLGKGLATVKGGTQLTRRTPAETPQRLAPRAGPRDADDDHT